MQESGASLLRAMQNESMIRLDLLVRESVQNVIDAAIKGPGDEVRVEYSIRTHATDTIASLLSDGLDGKKLRNRFPDGGRLLEIRDSLTEGLTGPLTLDEIEEGQSHGNLLKLVYEIGRTRTQEGAGGSWGLGKTCYFRMGAGLVFYYSRILLNNDFQERLVACLVENESSPDRLQTDTKTGIAWWGAEGMKPITKGSVIRDILERMGIRRFVGEETGTAIIIPFLRDDLISSSTYFDENENPTASLPAWWYSSYEAYLTVAIQRWFCVRLDNPLFATGPRLTVKVNGNTIRKEKMLPVFQAVQSMYNRAVHPMLSADDYFVKNGVDPSALVCESITLRSVFQSPGPAGKISGALLTASQLKMDAPDNNPDPYLCLFGRSDPTPPFRPIVTFMRKPGMSIRWDDSTEGRAWAGGLTGPADGRYLIAVFIAEQDRLLTKELRQALGATSATLESYLRSCERADHGQWRDITGQTIASRIRANVGKRLREFGSALPRNTTVAPAIRMARNLADLLLPQRGMGSDGRSGVNSPLAKSRRPGVGRAPGTRAMAFPSLDINGVDYQSDGIQVGWIFNWGKDECAGSKSRAITLGVDSEGGAISPEEWDANGLGAFPFKIAEVSVLPDDKSGEIRAASTISSFREGYIELSPLAGALDGIQIRGKLKVLFCIPSARSLRPLLRSTVHETMENMT